MLCLDRGLEDTVNQECAESEAKDEPDPPQDRRQAFEPSNERDETRTSDQEDTDASGERHPAEHGNSERESRNRRDEDQRAPQQDADDSRKVNPLAPLGDRPDDANEPRRQYGAPDRAGANREPEQQNENPCSSDHDADTFPDMDPGANDQRSKRTP